jgi:hypothetical protein
LGSDRGNTFIFKKAPLSSDGAVMSDAEGTHLYECLSFFLNIDTFKKAPVGSG